MWRHPAESYAVDEYVLWETQIWELYRREVCLWVWRVQQTWELGVRWTEEQRESNQEYIQVFVLSVPFKFWGTETLWSTVLPNETIITQLVFPPLVSLMLSLSIYNYWYSILNFRFVISSDTALSLCKIHRLVILTLRALFLKQHTLTQTPTFPAPFSRDARMRLGK